MDGLRILYGVDDVPSGLVDQVCAFFLGTVVVSCRVCSGIAGA